MHKERTYKRDLRRTLIYNGLIPIFIGSLLIFIFLLIYSNQYIVNRNLEINEGLSTVITDTYNDYYEMIENFSTLEEVRHFFEEGNNKTEVYEILYGFSNNQSVGSKFHVVDPHGNILFTNTYVENSKTNKVDFISGPFKRLLDSPFEISMGVNRRNFGSYIETVYYIGSSIIIEDVIVGYIVFDLLEQDFYELIHQDFVGVTVITDRYHNVLISSNALLIDDIGKFQVSTVDDKFAYILNDEKYYTKVTKIADGNINVVTLTSLRFSKDLFLVTGIFGLSILIFSVLLLRLASKKLAKDKTRSIDILIEAIKRIEQGDLDTIVNIDTNDEFELIGRYINVMLISFKNSLAENEELEKRKMVAEIKQLEAQFNPHFLFNVLETLKFMIKLDAEIAVKMLVSLSNVLRYSITDASKKVVLEEDLEYIKDYLSIQKYRFNKRFDYAIHLDTEAKDCIIPKLIIQPIIENSIKHGYINKAEMFIEFTAKVSDEQLVLSIRDNGDGIPKERQDELNQLLANNYSEENHIGLNNVHKRLRLPYGEKYGLTIESEEGKGTLVIINIPVIR